MLSERARMFSIAAKSVTTGVALSMAFSACARSTAPPRAAGCHDGQPQSILVHTPNRDSLAFFRYEPSGTRVFAPVGDLSIASGGRLVLVETL